MGQRTCSIEGCEAKHYGRGWCRNHHAHWIRHGDPLVRPPKKTLAERFWAKVDVRGPDECWPWTGTCKPYGYGQLIFAGKTLYAHRISWELHHGPIPAGLCVCHHCDNPPCVNPSCLFLGTNADNARDMVAKGRGFSRMRGITHCKHGHEFTPENTYHVKDGSRSCRTCSREQTRARRAALRYAAQN
jgi:hypothetical protein